MMALNLPVDLMPDMSPPYVAVITVYPAAGPEEVEHEITDILEEQLLNIEGLVNITSTSSEGSSLVLLEFEWGNTERDFADEVSKKIDQLPVQLPKEAFAPAVREWDPNAFPIITLSLQGDRSQDELTSIADNLIKPNLEQVKDAAKIEITGSREKIVKVYLYHDRLEAYGLSANMIAQALAVQNLDLGVGSFKRGAKDFLITTSGSYDSLEQIRNTIITSIPNGGDVVKVLVTDIAEVSFSLEDEASRFLVNGEPSIKINVYKQSGSNTVEVAKGIHDKIDELESQIPNGVNIVVLSDTSKMINQSMSEVFNAAFLGVLCSIIVLFLFLRQIKSTLIVAISIPVSILITLLGMQLGGKTINIVALTGLTLGVGMIVDASIVILENIFRYRQTGVPIKAAARFGTQEMITPILASILTTICVFLPILLLKSEIGVMGVMMGDLAFTVIVALISSLAVAIFLVPVLASTYLKVHIRGEKPIKNKFFRGIDNGIEKALHQLERGYKWVLQRAIKNKALTIITAVLILVMSFMQMPKLGMNMMPPESSETIKANIELPIGSSLESTKEALDQLEYLIHQNVKGYSDLFQTAGDPAKYQGSLTLLLPPLGEREITPDQIVEDVRLVASLIPDITYAVGQDSQMGGNFLAGGSDVVVKINGDDIDELYNLAVEIETVLAAEIPEISETGLDISTGLPELKIRLDRSKIYDLGLNAQSIAFEIRAQIAGVDGGNFSFNGESLDIIIQLREEDRSSTPDLEKLFVTNRQGQKVSLSSIAFLEEDEGPVSILHTDTKRSITIGTSLVAGASANFVDGKVRAVLAEKIAFPDNVRHTVGGDFDEIKKSASGLSIVLILAVILVLGVMISQFESIKAPLIVFLPIPMLAVGVIALYLALGVEFSMVSFVGVIMLVGIVVNNGIVLVDYISLLRKRGSNLTEACVNAGVSRLKPILMTTLTTVLAMVPLAFFAGEGGAMMQPLGLTVVGGLSFHTLTTLIIVPVLYSIFYRKEEKNEAL